MKPFLTVLTFAVALLSDHVAASERTPTALEIIQGSTLTLSNRTSSLETVQLDTDTPARLRQNSGFPDLIRSGVDNLLSILCLVHRWTMSTRYPGKAGGYLTQTAGMGILDP